MGVVDGIIIIFKPLKGSFGFSWILDLAFLFIEDIWHDEKKGSESILSSVSSKTLTVSQADNDLVDLWPNLWCNNSREIFFLAGDFFVFDVSLISPNNSCFLGALCGNVTAFLSLDYKYIVQNLFCNKQVCPEFINVMI